MQYDISMLQFPIETNSLDAFAEFLIKKMLYQEDKENYEQQQKRNRRNNRHFSNRNPTKPPINSCVSEWFVINAPQWHPSKP